MRTILKCAFIECIAAAATVVQMQNLVRTDEAKYLLNIPYPHPPLARTIISLSDGLPMQEIFWRFLLASLLLQLVWIVWSVGTTLPKPHRVALCVLWILNSAVLFQAGTVMIAPITAMEYLLFLWIYSHEDWDFSPYVGIIGFLWIASLFTAFQAILIIPVVFAVFYRLRLPMSIRALCFFTPLSLLALYILSNPFTLASMAMQIGKDSSNTLGFRILDTLKVWGLGGSAVLSFLGSWGLVRGRDAPYLLSFFLLTAYVFLGRYDYYAILFTPFFIVGAVAFFKRQSIAPSIVLGATSIGTAALFFLLPPLVSPSFAREIVHRLRREEIQGDLLISGSFGHEWQYESTWRIRRYRPEFLTDAGAVVCLDACPEVGNAEGWKRLQGSPVETWMKNM